MAHLLMGWWLGCGPPPIEQWRGCLAESAVLVPDPSVQVDAAGGTGVVLMVGTHWGEVPWLTDHGRTADVWVELPEPAAVGRYELAHVERWYKERSWSTQRVDGVIEIVELTPTDALVSLEVVVEAGENERRFTGQTRVRRGRGPWCRSPGPPP